MKTLLRSLAVVLLLLAAGCGWFANSFRYMTDEQWEHFDKYTKFSRLSMSFETSLGQPTKESLDLMRMAKEEEAVYDRITRARRGAFRICAGVTFVMAGVAVLLLIPWRRKPPVISGGSFISSTTS